MLARFAVLVAVAITASSSAGCGLRSSARVVELHRVVFATMNPGHPQTMAAAEAQIDLARVYAKGRGTKRNVDFGCGLAQHVLLAAEVIFQVEPLRNQAQHTVDDLCAHVDLAAALRVVACPVFGVKPQTLDAGAGARLTLSQAGPRLTNDSGVHDDLWIVPCGDIIVSPRLVRAEAAPGSRYVPTFLEMFVWHQSIRDDGSSVGPRLEWKVVEVLPWGLPQADGAVLRQYLGGSIWPPPPVPRAIARGATLRQLPSGEVHWHFKGAPEFGAGTVGILGGLP